MDVARTWRQDVEYHKSAIVQLVHFDHSVPEHPGTLYPLAYGPCWVVYETKVNGAWQRSIPHDGWSFFKTKIGLQQ